LLEAIAGSQPATKRGPYGVAADMISAAAARECTEAQGMLRNDIRQR